MGWIIPLISALAPIIGAGVQSASNRRNSRLQNMYNAPQRQMERFRKAGLNPNLMYTQGNSGNMTPITPTNWQDAIGGAGQRYAQTELTQTQQDIGEQKITESQVKSSLMQAQESLIKANPYLNKEFSQAYIDQAVAVFKEKQQQAEYMTAPFYEDQHGTTWNAGWFKMKRELDTLDKKYDLASKDLDIKGQVFTSKEFENDYMEVLNKFRVDGEIGPQQVWAFLMLLFGKFK